MLRSLRSKLVRLEKTLVMALHSLVHQLRFLAQAELPQLAIVELKVAMTIAPPIALLRPPLLRKTMVQTQPPMAQPSPLSEVPVVHPPMRKLCTLTNILTRILTPVKHPLIRMHTLTHLAIIITHQMRKRLEIKLELELALRLALRQALKLALRLTQGLHQKVQTSHHGSLELT